MLFSRSLLSGIPSLSESNSTPLLSTIAPFEEKGLYLYSLEYYPYQYLKKLNPSTIPMGVFNSFSVHLKLHHDLSLLMRSMLSSRINIFSSSCIGVNQSFNSLFKIYMIFQSIKIKIVIISIIMRINNRYLATLVISKLRSILLFNLYDEQYHIHILFFWRF